MCVYHQTTLNSTASQEKQFHINKTAMKIQSQFLGTIRLLKWSLVINQYFQSLHWKILELFLSPAIAINKVTRTRSSPAILRIILQKQIFSSWIRRQLMLNLSDVFDSWMHKRSISIFPAVFWVIGYRGGSSCIIMPNYGSGKWRRE